MKPTRTAIEKRKEALEEADFSGIHPEEAAQAQAENEFEIALCDMALASLEAPAAKVAACAATEWTAGAHCTKCGVGFDRGICTPCSAAGVDLAKVREALEPLAAFASGIGKIPSLAWSKPNHPDGPMYCASWGEGPKEITQADILRARDALAHLDSFDKGE